MSNPNQICFFSEPGDTRLFGSSVVVNEQYLAVSDPGANKVIIYTRNSSGNWLRTREILPPVNSVPHRVGHGFGRNLKLDDDALLISDEVILISSETEQYVKGLVDPQEFQFVDSVPVFVNRYLVKLSSKAELRRIKFYPSTILGFVEFITLSKGELKKIVLPDNGEEEFGYSSALHKNLFLVGSPNNDTGGGAWLFELDKSEKKTWKLSLPNAYMGTTVAISEKFIAVGFDAEFLNIYHAPNLLKKTLIRSIDSGVTSVIDEVGILSLSRNVLAVMRHELPDDPKPALLKVFRLDGNTKPSLIIYREQKELIDARVQNGFLVTVEGNYSSGINVCLESIQQ